MASSSSSTKATAAAMPSAAVDKEGGSGSGGVNTAGEFVVHSKHTCDKCFQRPILGQRYTSAAPHSNFDLCARCYETYTGPEKKGLTETALVRDKKISQDFVLKLKINHDGDVQVRRMKVAEIWDQSNLNFSVSKLLAVAVGFIDDNAAAQRDALIAKAKVTYLDEDGDEVYISSDDEVKDAFLQVLALLPIRKPFLVSVTLPKTGKVEEHVENKPTTTAVGGMPRRIQVRKVEPTKKAFSASIIGEQSPPVLRCMNKLNHALLRITPQSFENKFFVHARHTCDGCLKTPIIGTRYHATKIPDFDLCESCIKKYEGDDLDFVPEIQVRDLRMQHKWCKDWGPSRMMPTTMAGFTEFLNKVQESRSSSGVGSPAAVNPPEHAADSLKEAQQEPTNVETKTSASQTIHRFSFGPKPEMTGASPSSENSGGPEESFLSDADGNGSIAEVIGRTLDVCAAAIEELQNLGNDEGNHKEMFLSSKASVGDDVAAAVAACVDTFSVASSIVSGMTEIINKELDGSSAAETASVPSVVTGKMASTSGIDKNKGLEMPTVEDVSNEEDGWSVVEDDNDLVSDKSVSSNLSPVVLAKWDSELRQLHEMGFLDDRSNVDSLEHLEAAHIGVDSKEEVTVHQVVDHILENRAD